MLSSRNVFTRHSEGAKRGFFASILILLVLCLLASNLWTLHLLQKSPRDPSYRSEASFHENATTLVIYVFRNTDPEALNNLDFFLRHGIAANDGARYVVALDGALLPAEMPPLPNLPPNAEFITPPSCFEMGALGWILYSSGTVNVKSYKHFVWVSSCTKGPFQPSYVKTAWHRAFTDRLRAGVKLVGSTISCTSLTIDTAQPALEHPHVQTSGPAAADRVGLSLLKSVGALDCHNNWLDNMRYGEFAASAAVLNAGFNIDSLMLRYQGVDWRTKAFWKCNGMIDPRQEGSYDGASLNPLEVVFVRAEFPDLVLEKPTVAQAALYADWMSVDVAKGNGSIQGNSWLTSAAGSHPTIMSKPRSCFDAEFYIMASPMEFADFTHEDAYAHFKHAGYREGRPYMFLC